MKKLIYLLILLTSAEVLAQTHINSALKKQMDSIMVLEQKYREQLTYLAQPNKRDSIAKLISLSVNEANSYYWKLQNRTDSSNLLFVEAILNRYGYPGQTLVGVPTNEAAWNVIQHSGKIDTYIPIIKKAAEENELPFNLYAMMLDRYLMNKGQEQIYGTQAITKRINDKMESFIWPIKEPSKVNRLRKQAGFTTTVEDNAKRFGIIYKALKLNDVK
jgi:hypothetical protein